VAGRSRWVTPISKDEGAHYQTREVPFGRSYKWHPERTVVECDCGEELAFTGTSVTTTCRCGAEYGDLVCGIRYREGRLRDEDVHSWHHDVQSQANQHSRDEAAYPEGSPWRYDDVASGLGEDLERWKEARAQQGPQASE
jgi:hypothetical protein